MYNKGADLPEITRYYDYRQYLSDFYRAKKGGNPDYSYRVFARMASLGSPSHLKMVIDGQRNLSHRTIPGYLRALGLTKPDREYFETLVQFNQASDMERRQSLFEKLLASRQKRGLTPLEKYQYEFLSNWQHVVIYVLVGLQSEGATVEWVQRQLSKKLSPAEAQHSLQLLDKLDLIEEDEVGRWHQTKGALSTPDEVKDVAIRKYHSEMIRLGLVSLRNDPPEIREFNGVTLPVDAASVEKFKEMIRKFRKEMNQYASSVEQSDSVYQLNIQFFPY